MYAFTLALLFLLPIYSYGQIADVKSVPNPRLVNQWAVDSAGAFSSQEKAEIEAVLSEIYQLTQAEVALVTLRSIGNKVPKDFAVELFNFWKIGKRGKNNGLLILLVTDQRRIEMETGYGLEGVLPDVTLSRIQRELIVPSLQEGRAGAGFLMGLRKIEELLRKESVPPSSQNEAQTAHLPTVSEDQSSAMFATKILAGLTGLMLFCSFICILFLYKKSDPLWRYRQLFKDFRFLFFWQMASLVMPFAWFAYSSGELTALAGGTGLAALWYVVGSLTRTAWAERLRVQPRECPFCQKPMVLQDSKHEKAYEKPQEIVEEQIGSVDYDVWICPDNHVRKDGYEGQNAYKYSRCDKCHARARKAISDKVLEAATYSKSGLGERHYQCLACQTVSKKTYKIAQLSDAASSDESSGSSSGGGGSFGGGSSGGGGAGSSY